MFGDWRDQADRQGKKWKHEASDCFFWKIVADFRASSRDFSLIDDQNDDN